MCVSIKVWYLFLHWRHVKDYVSLMQSGQWSFLALIKKSGLGHSCQDLGFCFCHFLFYFEVPVLTCNTLLDVLFRLSFTYSWLSSCVTALSSASCLSSHPSCSFAVSRPLPVYLSPCLLFALPCLCFFLNFSLISSCICYLLYYLTHCLFLEFRILHFFVISFY